MITFELIVFIGGLWIGIPIGMIIEHILNERKKSQNQSLTTKEE